MNNNKYINNEHLSIIFAAPSIKICHRNDPQINDCIIKSIEQLRPRLASGTLGDGFDIPKIEPFSIHRSAFDSAFRRKLQLLWLLKFSNTFLLKKENLIFKNYLQWDAFSKSNL